MSQNQPPPSSHAIFEAEALSHIRHELRTPLNQIIGYSEMLEEDAVDAGQDALVPDLQKIQKAARNLDGLIQTHLGTHVLGALDAVIADDEVHQSAAGEARQPVGFAIPDADDAAEVHLTQLCGHVLAVDDNESNRDMLSRRLLRHGLTVEVAVNGIDALAQLEAKSFDLVLLDIMMPELDGYEVLKRMKASDNLRHIPVVMISALDELESVVRCIEAGAEDYLSKPFNPTLLRARIGACLEKKALRDQEQEYLATIETTQKRLKRELDDATTYVRSILPEPETKPYPIDWVYTPSTELGGDAFGYHWIDDDHFAMYLLDVCGHGVGASLLSVAAINVMRNGSIAQTDFRDPAQVLTRLNNMFLMERQNNMYFTLWYGVFQKSTRKLTFSGGGHPPSLLYTGDIDGGEPVLQELHRGGLPIGALEDVPYGANTVDVPADARLLILCDGTYEIELPEGGMLGLDGLTEFIRPRVASPTLLTDITEWIRTFHGDGPLEDDFSLVRVHLC
jgi:sigma-B regulation protein RsbU (phosphoserine phosphatase)